MSSGLIANEARARLEDSILAWQRDRREFEIAAWALSKDSEDSEGYLFLPDGTRVDAMDVIQARYEAASRPHLSRLGNQRLGAASWGNPPQVKPELTQFQSWSIRGNEAIVTTLEQDFDPDDPPSRYEYRLALEDGEWRISERTHVYEEDGKTKRMRHLL